MASNERWLRLKLTGRPPHDTWMMLKNHVSSLMCENKYLQFKRSPWLWSRIDGQPLRFPPLLLMGSSYIGLTSSTHVLAPIYSLVIDRRFHRYLTRILPRRLRSFCKHPSLHPIPIIMVHGRGLKKAWHASRLSLSSFLSSLTWKQYLWVYLLHGFFLHWSR